MIAAWDDPRIASGMRQQLRRRRELLELGEKPLGWKLAFGGPAAMARLQTNAPLVGFLLHRAVVPSQSELSLAGWKKPAAEPELTVYLGKTLAAGSDRNTTMAAIAGLGPAIEIADVDHPSEDVQGTLARNIYQRNLVIGPPDARYAGGVLTGLLAKVRHSEKQIADTNHLEALTGELVAIVQHVANLLAVFGETLDAGQIIIAGSITPPVWVQPGEQITFHLEPLDPISVTFSPQKT
ncbi:MAG TPA: fumarylacetoacetate hydrolase family protein [Candidatus Acidoferrum sp.]